MPPFASDRYLLGWGPARAVGSIVLPTVEPFCFPGRDDPVTCCYLGFPMIAISSNDSIGIDGELESPLGHVLPSAVVRGKPNPLHIGLPLRLRRARRAAKLSFERLASAAGLPSGITAFHLERTAGHVPRLDTVERIASALSLSPAFLAFGIQADAAPLVTGLRCDGVGQRLADERTARGLSVLAVAKLAGLSHTAVGNVERGTMPTLATAEALAKALDLSPGWLAFGVGPQELPARRRSRSTGLSSARA